LKNFTFFLYNPYCFTKVVIFNVPEEIVILLNLIRPHPYLPIAPDFPRLRDGTGSKERE